eukprot:CAMPEP_0171215186 /NCGR_PEP_ID=MMETSP0790-20130122/31539_1 /TAXON_ID=2925 /ORGANISM="Alexandrium catenella, Strain OF101" /LENGTH=64 /DNA_ID=CAMNT_0011680935 /DNA_START=420 /DNA_END=611 /DNA_ORIENTATION=-
MTAFACRFEGIGQRDDAIHKREEGSLAQYFDLVAFDDSGHSTMQSDHAWDIMHNAKHDLQGVWC